MILHNEVIDAILNRRSIRSYQKKQISEDALQTILEAGRYAPSGMNQQSAKAVVIQSPHRMQQLVQLAKTVSGTDRNPFYDAPTVILIFGNPNCLTPINDGTLAIENMFLAAYSLGIGTCWIYAVQSIFQSPEGKAFMQEIGVPEGDIIIGSLAVGYHDGTYPEPKPKNSAFYTIV